MSIFSTILDKLGIHKKEEKPKPAVSDTHYTPDTPKPTIKPPRPTIKPPTTSAPYVPGGVYPRPSTTPPAVPVAATVKPAPMEMVDVVSNLDALAKKSKIAELNWRQSIVDLLKLLGMPATGKAIKDLAVELGCPEKEMADSYSRNVWTHKELLKKIAENGGNIPQNLLD